MGQRQILSEIGRGRRVNFEPLFAEGLASALEVLRRSPVQAILIHLPIRNCS